MAKIGEHRIPSYGRNTPDISVLHFCAVRHTDWGIYFLAVAAVFAFTRRRAAASSVRGRRITSQPVRAIQRNWQAMPDACPPAIRSPNRAIPSIGASFLRKRCEEQLAPFRSFASAPAGGKTRRKRRRGKIFIRVFVKKAKFLCPFRASTARRKRHEIA